MDNNSKQSQFLILTHRSAHQQANTRVKGVGGITGLTQNRDMLERQIVTGPEINRVVEEFTGANDNDDGEKTPSS